MANEPLDEFDRRLKAKKEYANYGFIADIDSGLSSAETLGFYDLQKMSDDEYNKFSQAVKSNSSPTIDTSSIITDDKPGIGTAVMNGLKGSVRGLFGAAKAAIDANIEAHKGDKNVVKEYDQSENISKALGYVTDEILKREEVKADTAAGQLGYDLAENGIQLLAQLALTKGVGAAGAGAKTVHAISMLYNGANISGEQYLRLRKEGVSASRAAEAGLMNAIPQAVLEELPLGRLLKKMPAGSGLKAKIWEVTKRGLEEGVTEALQEFPEQATDLWAKNPGASTAKLAEKWGENWQQNLKEAGYSGLIGAILGGTASGVSVAVDSAVEHVALKANEERKAKLVADAERIKETGINPERAAAEIEANNPNFEDDTVTVSAQDLEGYKQTSNNNKLFDELGVTAEEVATAAELGQDIDISRGKFTAAMAKDNVLFEATKDNMYFDSNGELSDGGAKTRKELREGYNLTRLASTELDAELDAIVGSATKAGMNKSHAGNLRLVLESRALIADPENPAAWLQKNKLRFEDGGKGTAGRKQRGWTQKVWGRAKGWKQNSQTEIKGQFRQADDGTYIIDLFKGADASTAIHETGHYFTETMINEALADPSNTRLNADAKKLMEYAGIDADVWASGDIEAKRAGHEKLAEAFETYIMEGKAPSVGLRGAFQRFANWLSAIYSKIARSENAAELTPEVRQVFDRMLACREEIEVMARMEGMFGGLPKNITSKLSDQNKKALQDKILKAKDKAVDILTRRAMADFSAKRRAEKAAFIEEIRPQIEEAVALELVNRARHQVGYEFGKEVKAIDSHFIDDEHGMAHANFKQKINEWETIEANPRRLARKYIYGNERINYNELLKDTNGAIDDILNPIADRIESELAEYQDTVKSERAFFINGKWGYFAATNRTEGKYANDFAGIPDQSAVLVDFGEIGKDGKRHWTKRALEQADIEGLVFHEAGDSIRNVNWVSRYVHDSGGSVSDLTSKKGRRKIAETLVEGEQLTELNELKALKHELETNPDKVDLVEMSKKRALSNEQRELFDWVADSLGYDSGDAMAQDILTSPSERAMVRQEIDKAVKRRFPDFMQEREQAREAAREALYNDESGEVVALEQQLIDEALNEISDKDIKQKERENIAKVRKQNADNFAKRYIQTLPAGEVMKPRRFAMAERRAAANANKAAKAGLLEEAAMYKQQQMINHALYREAVKAKHQIESARKYVRKQMHSKKEVWGTEQHFFQMCALLERMGYRRKDFNTNGREVQPLSDYIAEMQAKYGDEIISMPEFVLNPNNDLTNAPQLSLANYMDVIDALKNIRAIAKQDTQMNKIAAGEAFEQVKADTIAHLQELPVEYEAEIGSDSKKSLRKRIVEWPKNIVATLRNADNFFLMMDNWTEEGYFTREFYNKINHCADMESTMLESYQNELIDALQKWEPDKKTGIAHEQRIYYEELGGSADKHALIAMLCNLGSDSNAARLCSQKPVGVKNSDIWVEESELIGREEAMLQTKQNLIEFLCKHLTKEDIAYAQARINAASKFWPMLAEVNRRTKGFEPPKIEASPLVLKLASGESVVFDGGYFPLERDTRTGSMPGKFDRIDSTEEGSRPPQRTLSTNIGSSKARTGGKYPVDLSRGSEVTAVKSTIHDICYRETMLDFRKILNDEDIYRNMVERLGDTNVRLLREFLQACANPYGNKTAYMAENLFTKAANALRNIATNTAIMLNFKTAMQNFSNILLYGNSVEGFTHADAFRALYRGFTGEGRAEVDAICAKSVFMRERMQVPDVTLRDIQNRSDLNPIEKKTLKYGALLLGYTDMMTAKPVFAEAYMKKINEGKTEQEALDFANAVIRRTLGSSRIHDVSSLQRGSGLFRLFTMFQGFFNTQFNQWDREAHIAKRLWNSGEKKEMAERLIAFVTAKWLAVCLLNVAIAELSLTAPFEKDKKDDWNNLAKDLINYPLSMGGPVGQAANVGVQNLLGMRNYGYRLAAVQGLIDRGFTVARRINGVAEGKEEPGELIEQTAYVGGAWLGIPSGIFNIIFNSIDIAADNMDFELQDIYKRRPKSERKKD